MDLINEQWKRRLLGEATNVRATEVENAGYQVQNAYGSWVDAARKFIDATLAALNAKFKYVEVNTSNFRHLDTDHWVAGDYKRREPPIAEVVSIEVDVDVAKLPGIGRLSITFYVDLNGVWLDLGNRKAKTVNSVDDIVDFAERYVREEMEAEEDPVSDDAVFK